MTTQTNIKLWIELSPLVYENLEKYKAETGMTTDDALNRILSSALNYSDDLELIDGNRYIVTVECNKGNFPMDTTYIAEHNIFDTGFGSISMSEAIKIEPCKG